MAENTGTEPDAQQLHEELTVLGRDVPSGALDENRQAALPNSDAGGTGLEFVQSGRRDIADTGFSSQLAQGALASSIPIPPGQPPEAPILNGVGNGARAATEGAIDAPAAAAASGPLAAAAPQSAPAPASVAGNNSTPTPNGTEAQAPATPAGIAGDAAATAAPAAPILIPAAAAAAAAAAAPAVVPQAAATPAGTPAAATPAATPTTTTSDATTPPATTAPTTPVTTPTVPPVVADTPTVATPSTPTVDTPTVTVPPVTVPPVSVTDPGVHTDPGGGGGVPNPSPLAVDLHMATTELGSAVSIDALKLDSPGPGASHLTISNIDTTGMIGTLSVKDGQITYDPGNNFISLAAGETTTTSFSYQVRNEYGETSTAHGIITITGVNTAPDAVDHGDKIGQNDSVSLKPVTLASDSDHGAVLHLQSVDSTGVIGKITVTGDQITYDTNHKFDQLAVGETTAETYTYTVTDEHGATVTKTETITIVGANDAPDAVDHGDKIGQNATVTLNPLTNADVNATDIDNGAKLTQTIDSSHTTGTVTVGVDGTVTYDTNHKFDTLAQGETTTDTYTYTITDEHGASVTRTETITITGSNDGPTANDHGDKVGQNDAPITLNVLTDGVVNAHDIDHGAVLSLKGVDSTHTAGTVTVGADGTITYDTNHKFDYLDAGETTTDSYTYTITDEHGATVTKTETITITGSNDGPTANNHGDQVAQNATVTLNPLTNVLVDAKDIDHNAKLTQTIDSSHTTGKVTVGADGTVTYDTNHKFDTLAQGETTTDTYTYTVTDEHGASVTKTETITITGSNDGPTANNHGDAVSQNGAPVTLNVLTDSVVNAQDVDHGAVLSLKGVDSTHTAGTVTVGADGTITYDTNHKFDYLDAGETTTDSYTYTITDEHGASVTKTETITITGTNDGPTANNHSDLISQNATVTLNPLTNVDVNAKDIDHNAKLTQTIDSSHTTGKVTVGADGTVTYDTNHKFDTLAQGETTTDTYTYTITDEHGASVTKTETITITGSNDGPTANNHGDAVSQNGAPVTLNVLTDSVVNAQDVDHGAVLSLKGVDSTHTAGTVTVGADGTITYDTNHKFDYLDAGETTTDSYTYTITDEHGASVTKTETITITGTNDGPTANNHGDLISQNATVTLNPLTNVDVNAKDIDHNAS